eukprot:CAMPEP_0172690926 /NCGR_PEP_ID=MMETSP1074-20121228/24210_1 /TAXON_ID=2916 /ORGANISM="Ceratium fusus, Strain PA161109" /LENGTH=182 /DNA_ID=CAMNT_0013510931 /DNA_START=78 /DNA_END=622 /DNA_ORIENTATION=+
MPSTDITLAGGSGRPVQIVSVRDKGVAAIAGARIGDRLASIDGKKDFMELPATVIQDRLKAPTSLVFMGFIGKLEAEVRLHNVEEAWGIPNQDVIRGDHLELRDVTVLNRSLTLMAPLFLTTLPAKTDVPSCQPNSNECKATGTNPTGTNPTGTNHTGTNPTGTNPTLQPSTGIAGKRSAQA